MVNETRYDEKEREIRSMLKEFSTANISIDNYTRWFDKIKNKKEIILTDIGSIEDAKYQLIEDAKEMQKSSVFQSNRERNLVSVEYYNIRRDITRLTQKAYSWIALLNEMYELIATKSFELFDDVKAYTLKKESLELMKEDSKRISQMTIDMTKSNNNMTKDIIDNQINMMQQQFGTTINAMLQSFSTIVSKINGVEASDVKAAVKTIEKVAEQKTKTSVATAPSNSEDYDGDESSPMKFEGDKKEEDFEKGFEEFN